MVFKVDLHNHTTDFSHFIFTSANKKQYLLKLLSKLYKKDGKLVVGVTESNNDKRYSKFVGVIRKLPEDYVVDFGNRDYFISIKNGKKIIYFVRTDEIETDKGHILIIGNKSKINSRNLKSILKLARKEKLIVIADHPLHEMKKGYFLIMKILGMKRWSLDKKSIRKNKADFSGIELNSYFPEDWDKIKKFAKKNKIPVVAESDAHNIHEFFDSYFEVKYLNFKNIKTLKKSLRTALRQHVKVHSKKHGFFARYKHGLDIILFEKLFRKLGIVKD